MTSSNNSDADIASEVFGNLVEAETLKKDAIEALDKIAAILSLHAGPYAFNSIIGSKYRQHNDIDEFTKDGIKILQHLVVSDDPSERLVTRLARFVGWAVDGRCHDGTTTSMLLFSLLAKIAVEKIDTRLFSKQSFVSSIMIKKSMERVLYHLEKLKITPQNVLEKAEELGIQTSELQVKKAIAFHMAMVASKGDRELAEKVAMLVGYMPTKFNNVFTIRPAQMETTTRYKLQKSEYDFSVGGGLILPDLHNYKNGTQFLAEDAVLFITPNDIVDQTYESMFLSAFLMGGASGRATLNAIGVEKTWKEVSEGKRPLVIMSPDIGSSELIYAINEFNKKNKDAKVIPMRYSSSIMTKQIFAKSVVYSAGKQMFDDCVGIDTFGCLLGLDKDGVKIHKIGNEIHISGLYEKNGETYHPYLGDTENHPEYNTFIADVEEQIEASENNVTNPIFSGEDLVRVIDIYRHATCQEVYNIKVGGLRHEQAANWTVYEDAIGAALSAVNDGFVFGGYGHLYRLIKSHAICELDDRVADQLLEVLSISLRLSDKEKLSRNLMENKDEWSYHVASHNVTLDDVHFCFNLATIGDKDGMTRFLDYTIDDHKVLIQAYSGFHEQLQRFGDILPKLTNSAQLIDTRAKNVTSVN